MSQKNIVNKMNVSIICKAGVNQWRNTKEVMRWFNNLENKKQLSYHYIIITFDIVDLCPSITDDLLFKTHKKAEKIPQPSRNVVRCYNTCKNNNPIRPQRKRLDQKKLKKPVRRVNGS